MKGLKQFLAAFFLVVAAMQAAAKADGAGLCLRDDATGESFSELTRRYALEAPGSVSLNLPAGSQAALERFVGVPHFPFSLLLDRRGRPVKGEIPRPSQADELLRLVEEAE